MLKLKHMADTFGHFDSNNGRDHQIMSQIAFILTVQCYRASPPTNHFESFKMYMMSPHFWLTWWSRIPGAKKTVWWLWESGLRLASVRTVELDWWNFNQSGLNHGGRRRAQRVRFLTVPSSRRRFCRGGSAVKSFEPVWFTVTECVHRLRAVQDHFVNIFVCISNLRFFIMITH